MAWAQAASGKPNDGNICQKSGNAAHAVGAVQVGLQYIKIFIQQKGQDRQSGGTKPDGKHAQTA